MLFIEINIPHKGKEGETNEKENFSSYGCCSSYGSNAGYSWRCIW